MILTFAKGLMKLVPIIAGVVVGYIVALFMHQVDFAGVVAAPWFSFPVKFDTISHFSWEPFLYMLPVAIAPVLEHIGDVYVVGAVAKKDFVAQPGLHRTMFGDGLACLASAFLGGPPETTYSEVTGAMSITKVTSPAVIRISAATALLFSVIGKLSALLQSVPKAVLGGIMLLLFGTIASVGVQNLMQRKVDMNDTRNIIIMSVMLTMGLGGAVLSSGNFAISGIGLAAVVGVVLNLLLPKTKTTEEKERREVLIYFPSYGPLCSNFDVHMAAANLPEASMSAQDCACRGILPSKYRHIPWHPLLVAAHRQGFHKTVCLHK